MPLTPLEPTDTRALFRPVCGSLVALLQRLPDDAWEKPAVGTWQVRDVVAHLTDVSMRRLSFHRDRHAPPPPPFPIQSDQDFTRFINQINADWVAASRRLSPRQLTEMYTQAGTQLSDFVETLPLEGPGLFGVSWAGERESPMWFDVGREFTEQWHHQAQIREAVGALPVPDPTWLHVTLAIALRGLPHAYRDVAAADGTTLTLNISGESGGTWTLERAGAAWRLMDGTPGPRAAFVTMSDDAAWRLLFNGLTLEKARAAVTVTGDAALVEPLLRARAIVI